MVAGVLASMCFVMPNADAAQKSIYDSPDGVHVGARTAFRYFPDSLFRVKTKMGFVTDIELKQGETVTYIAGGDTSRWLIDKAMVSNVQHVYIKPVEKDIKTNIIINTNLHSYRIEVVSGENYDPLVTFQFNERLSTRLLRAAEMKLVRMMWITKKVKKGSFAMHISLVALMFFTLGIAGILWVIDFFSLMHKGTDYNENLERELLVETIH